MTGDLNRTTETGQPAFFNRRRLLAAGAVAAGGIYLGTGRGAFSAARPTRGRVIVVGAGLAGLSAAWELERRGWDVTVLEARKHIGGRCHTLRGFAGGQTAEAGGEYIDTTHREMRRFAAGFGLRLEDVRASQSRYDDVAYIRGRFRNLDRYAGGRVWSEIDRFYESAWRLARKLDLADPVAAGARHDRRSVADFIDQLGITGRARQVLGREIRDDYAIEPAKLSLLFLLVVTKATWNTPDSGEEAFRIRGGNDRIAYGFARRLRRSPKLGARVTAVRLTSGGVEVTAGGESFEGHQVILAAPLPGLRGVKFEPALPDKVAGAIRQVQYGPITKTPLQYDRRFWHRRGFSGDTFTDLPVSTTWEATDRQSGRRGILMTYASGDAALSTARKAIPGRIKAAASELDRIYPGSGSQLGRATSVAWSNSSLNGGAYSAFAPGQVSDFWTALRRPIGPIHLAGEHTATLTGYMEGALRSGLLVARRIDASRD